MNLIKSVFALENKQKTFRSRDEAVCKNPLHREFFERGLNKGVRSRGFFTTPPAHSS